VHPGVQLIPTTNFFATYDFTYKALRNGWIDARFGFQAISNKEADKHNCRVIFHEQGET
jgi:hypothetical protein